MIIRAKFDINMIGEVNRSRMLFRSPKMVQWRKVMFTFVLRIFLAVIFVVFRFYTKFEFYSAQNYPVLHNFNQRFHYSIAQYGKLLLCLIILKKNSLFWRFWEKYLLITKFEGNPIISHAKRIFHNYQPESDQKGWKKGW